MPRRKAFEDIGKWIIFKHPVLNTWTVTPPYHMDQEIERGYPTFNEAVEYFALKTDAPKGDDSGLYFD